MRDEDPAAAKAPDWTLEIAVRTDADRIAAFRAASGGAAQEAGFSANEPAVPLTYPFCWLTSPEVRPTLERLIGGAAALPVHEAQSFDYRRPLALNADYRVAFAFARTAAPERLTVAASILTPAGEACASFETVLRIVPLAGQTVPADG